MLTGKVFNSNNTAVSKSPVTIIRLLLLLLLLLIQLSVTFSRESKSNSLAPMMNINAYSKYFAQACNNLTFQHARSSVVPFPNRISSVQAHRLVAGGAANVSRTIGCKTTWTPSSHLVAFTFVSRCVSARRRAVSSTRPLQQESKLRFPVFSFQNHVAADRLFSTFTQTKSNNHDNDDDKLFKRIPYIDENIADPASYAIPTFQKGDDMLIDLPKGTRIVSFGDVHGDILALYKFLQASKLLHPKSTITHPIWNGGNAILVQCGDILDRGAEELFCLRYLTSLARQAPEQGGKVILLHGNHEALNANGLFQYADPRGNQEIEVVLGKTLDKMKSDGSERWRLQYAGNVPSRWAAFEPNGWLAKPLYSNMSVAAVVGKTIFVHAGLTKDHLMKYGGIEKMNQDARNWFLTEYPEELRNDDGYKFQTVQEVIDNANLRARTASKTMPECLGGGIGAASPVWMRDYSSPSDSVPRSPKAQQMIDECLAEIGNGVERMVMGHTPQNQINAALKGKAWRIDVGASRGVMNGTPEVLEIIHQGGENGEDIISILTVEGDRIPASERQMVEIPF